MNTESLRAALRESQTGAGSYGPHYDGAKLAAKIEALIAATPAQPLGAVVAEEIDPWVIIDINYVLGLADTHAEDTLENGHRIIDRGGILQLVADVIKRYGSTAIAAQTAAPAAAQADILKHRQEGRAEAFAILLTEDPEDPFGAYASSSQCGATGEYDTHWDEAKLREAFSVDDATYAAFDKAEAEYYHYLGLQMEAEAAQKFAANMNRSGEVRAALCKAGEHDLVASLCCDVAAPAQAVEPKLTLRDGCWWPDGYCRDPDGKIIPPADKHADFNFGYDIGYGDGLVAIRDSVKAIEDRVRGNIGATPSAPLASEQGAEPVGQQASLLMNDGTWGDWHSLRDQNDYDLLPTNKAEYRLRDIYAAPLPAVLEAPDISMSILSLPCPTPDDIKGKGIFVYYESRGFRAGLSAAAKVASEVQAIWQERLRAAVAAQPAQDVGRDAQNADKAEG